VGGVDGGMAAPGGDRVRRGAHARSLDDPLLSTHHARWLGGRKAGGAVRGQRRGGRRDAAGAGGAPGAGRAATAAMGRARAGWRARECERAAAAHPSF